MGSRNLCGDVSPLATDMQLDRHIASYVTLVPSFDCFHRKKTLKEIQ